MGGQGRGGNEKGNVVSLVIFENINMNMKQTRMLHTHTHTHTHARTHTPNEMTGGSFLLIKKMLTVTELAVMLTSLGYTVTVTFLCGLSAMASFVIKLKKENCCKTCQKDGRQ